MGNSTGREPRFPPDPLGIEELTNKLDDLKNRYEEIENNLLYIRDRVKFESTKQDIAKDISKWGELILYIRESNQLPVNDLGESLSKSDLIYHMNKSLTNAGTLQIDTLKKRVNERITWFREHGKSTKYIRAWLSKNYSWVPYSYIEDKGVSSPIRDAGENEQGYNNDRAF